MKWMEMIRLMSSVGGHEDAIAAAGRQLREIEGATRGVEVYLLQHALYDGDLAALLVWNNDRQPVRTREGLLLAQNLHRFGTVDHAVWHAAPGFEEPECDRTPESTGAEGGE